MTLMVLSIIIKRKVLIGYRFMRRGHEIRVFFFSKKSFKNNDLFARLWEEVLKPIEWVVLVFEDMRVFRFNNKFQLEVSFS